MLLSELTKNGIEHVGVSLNNNKNFISLQPCKF